MNHPLRRNLLSLTVAQGVSRLSATLLAIAVARLLGPRSLGVLAFAQAITIYFTILSDFGLTTLGVREIAKDTGSTSYWASQILRIQLALSIGLVALLGAAVLVLPIDVELKLVLFLFGAGIVPAALDLSFVFQARQQMAYVALNRMVSQLLYLGLGLLLLLTLRQAAAVPLANLIGTSVAAIMTFLMLHRTVEVRIFKFEIRASSSVASVAIPFVTGGLLTGLYHNSIPVLLRAFTNFRSVGLFSAGYRVVMVLLSGADIVSNALLPAIAFSYVKDRRDFLRHSLVLAQTLGAIACGITVVGSLIAPQLFIFVFGNEYSTGLLAFRVLLVLPVLGMLSTALTAPLLVANEQVHCMLSVTVGVVATVVVSLVLVPSVGITGGAIATLVGEAGIVVYLLVVFARKLGFARTVVSSYVTRPVVVSIAVLLVHIVWTEVLHLPSLMVEALALVTTYFLMGLAVRLVPPELLRPALVGRTA